MIAATRSPSLLRVGRYVLAAVVVGLVGAVNVYLAGRSIGLMFGGAPAVDWEQYVEAFRRLDGGDLYAVSETYAYHYSPLLAYVFGLLAPLGVVGWRLLHLAAAFALPSWPMRLLALVSWPLWYDIEAGNLMMFVVLAAAWALKGNRVGIGIHLALTLLVPRPLMAPVAIWLLWKRSEWLIPFVAALGVHLLVVIGMGWGAAWLAALLAAGADVGIPSNVGPSRFVGTVPWLLIGLPVAAWMTWKGRVGLASLAASPYWLPYYLLMPLLALVRFDRRQGSTR